MCFTPRTYIDPTHNPQETRHCGVVGGGYPPCLWGLGVKQVGLIMLTFPLHPLEGQIKEKTVLPSNQGSCPWLRKQTQGTAQV